MGDEGLKVRGGICDGVGDSMCVGNHRLKLISYPVCWPGAWVSVCLVSWHR